MINNIYHTVHLAVWLCRYMSAYECFYLFDHFPSVKNHIKNLISKNEIAMIKRFLFWIEGEKRERGLRV